jgi:hypothetical protein
MVGWSWVISESSLIEGVAVLSVPVIHGELLAKLPSGIVIIAH